MIYDDPEDQTDFTKKGFWLNLLQEYFNLDFNTGTWRRDPSIDGINGTNQNVFEQLFVYTYCKGKI